MLARRLLRRVGTVGTMLALALLTTARSSDAQGSRPEPPPAERIVIDLDKLSAVGVTNLDTIPSWTQDDIRAQLAGKTRLSSTPVHGTQISYATANGRIYLWYPGNEVVLPGRWKADDWSVELRRGGQVIGVKQQPRACYDYGPGTYNPATGRSGGWECTNFIRMRFPGTETQSGDVFGLSRRKTVPFALSKDPATIDSLKARLKADAKRQD